MRPKDPQSFYDRTNKEITDIVEATYLQGNKLTALVKFGRWLSRWARKPELILSLLNVLVAVAAIVIPQLSSDIRELSFSYSKPVTIASLTPAVEPNATITFNGIPIRSLNITTVYLKNTGNKGFEAADFKDGPLKLSVFPLKPIKKGRNNHALFLLYTVSRKTAGQSKDKLEFKSGSASAVITYVPSVLNKGDTVELELYTSSPEPLQISPQVKILNCGFNDNGLIKGPPLIISAVSSLETSFGALNRALRGKIVSLLVLVFLMYSSTISFAVLRLRLPRQKSLSEHWALVTSIMFSLILLMLFIIDLLS